MSTRDGRIGVGATVRMSHTFGRGVAGPGRQRGLVLLMTLIALVAMTFASLAMVRSVDTTNLVAGNIAMKQAAMQEADSALNLAFECLDAGGGLTTVSRSTNNGVCNYYATVQPDVVKPFGVPDVLDSVTGAVNASTGFTHYYVIERLCNSGAAVWDLPLCVQSPFGRPTDLTNLALNALNPPQALYRVSVKVTGPRNISAYAQAIVNGGT